MTKCEMIYLVDPLIRHHTFVHSSHCIMHSFIRDKPFPTIDVENLGNEMNLWKVFVV